MLAAVVQAFCPRWMIQPRTTQRVSHQATPFLTCLAEIGSCRSGGSNESSG